MIFGLAVFGGALDLLWERWWDTPGPRPASFLPTGGFTNAIILWLSYMAALLCAFTAPKWRWINVTVIVTFIIAAWYLAYLVLALAAPLLSPLHTADGK